MKLEKIASICIATLACLNINLTASADNKKLIYSGFRQGVSWEVYLLNKKFVKEIETGGETRRLYLVDTEINNSYSGISRQTNLVQCSTSEPFIAFKDDYSPGSAVIDFINPGGEMYGYNTGTHWQYWVVCHNLWQPWEYNLEYKAIQLGYSTELKTEQTRIPYGLLQYVE